MLERRSGEPTDGKWFEALTCEAAPHIRDWNLSGCWAWEEWPDRADVMPGAPSVDVGIDLVARRGDDGRWVAIQVKSRQLDESGAGSPVLSGEMDKFLSASADRDIWAERWVAVNGNVGLSGHSPGKAAMSGSPVAVVNVAHAVERQRAALAEASDARGSAQAPAGGGEAPPQTRSEMQREAVELSVKRLRDNEMAEEPGIPKGEARGRIVLPCGAGKTRIALRIVEELTCPGELSVVLCPSIALVAQIRREFLEHAARPLRCMAVCSDQGVAAGEEKVANADDPTLDRGLETVDTLKGCPVTTDPSEIAEWIRGRRSGPAGERVSVIFGTYQSAGRVSDGIARADGFKVLICDEAHRTAGVRRRKRSTAAEERLRDFTLCHDRDAFPAAYRVYQTATPRIYGGGAQSEAEGRSKRAGEYVVRHMDDQSVFGVELYRRSYADAVENGWLSDYRIIAIGVGDQRAVDVANDLVREADLRAAIDAEAAAAGAGTAQRRSKRRDSLPTTGDYLKGMAVALALGGGARSRDGARVPLKSCIGFLNTIVRSKAMTDVLQSDAVKEWIRGQTGGHVSDFRLQHLDASSPVAGRDEAKRHLSNATADNPHAVLNVGIFGEGTDSPSLSAVAFLEPRKSPIDVVQAVGRAMRRAPGKDLGYIVVPVVIPPGEDAERFLATSEQHEGWRELGDILQALRAHDKRIEDSLPEMLTVQLPPEQPALLNLKTLVAVGRTGKRYMEYAVLPGSQDEAEDAARDAVEQGIPLLESGGAEPFDETLWQKPSDQPTSMLVLVERTDGSTEARADGVVRDEPKQGQQRGDVNAKKTKWRAARTARGERGQPLPSPSERERRRKEQEAQKNAVFEEHIKNMLLDLSGDIGGDIAMNLLEKSGLTGNKVQRDLNLLRDAVEEAARCIHEESGLAAALDEHFGLDLLAKPKQNKPRADGPVIAALLWMNAAMLHQRIHAGGWIARRGIEPLSEIKASTDPDNAFEDSWNAITRQDFIPVLEPALLALSRAQRTGRLGGLRRALRHIAAEAEHIAEVYADMGTDHAGALFNKVMGDQSSDGAFFTRPAAADIAARLALEAVDPDNEMDWASPDVWRQHKTVDLACGSGTLLAAVMAEMKRRAALKGADRGQLAGLQKVAVEETLKGFDINPVSLQLAATQLMSGNADVKYRKMGLHLMPYGRQDDGAVAAGTLELLARSEIVRSGRLFDDAAESETLQTGLEGEAVEGPDMDDAAEGAVGARLVVINPPFTNRSKCGEKFDGRDQAALRQRIDSLEKMLVKSEPSLDGVLDKNSVRPMFETLAGKCRSEDNGSTFVMISPTIIATASSAAPMRPWIAERFHVHTILTCHDPAQPNLSQDTAINESVFVFQRLDGARPPTRIVSLDRLPRDEQDIDSLFAAIGSAGVGALSGGWGEVSEWPAERIAAGNWSAVAWRNPALAEAAAMFAGRDGIAPIGGERDVRPQDRASAQRGTIPQTERRELTVQTTLQALYSDYRKAGRQSGEET